MTTQRSIGWAGFWQLVGMTAIGVAAWSAIAALWWDDADLPVAGLVLGAALMAIVVPLGLVIGWNTRGGRNAFRETYGWIRAGSVPADVPEWVWRPRVTQIRQDVRMNGFSALCAPVVAALLLWSAVAGGAGPTWGNVVIWGAFIAVNGFRWVRWHGRVRRLLDAPRATLHIPEGWRDCPPVPLI